MMLGSKRFLPAYDQSIKAKMVEAQDERGYRMWQCTDCSYSNKKTSHVYRHIERKHVVVALSCDLCALTFTCKEALVSHKKLHY
jgi:hypothetical protein